MFQHGIADEEDAAHDSVPQVRGRDDGVQQDPVGAPRSLERPDETSDGVGRNKPVRRRAGEHARGRRTRSTSGTRPGNDVIVRVGWILGFKGNLLSF